VIWLGLGLLGALMTVVLLIEMSAPAEKRAGPTQVAAQIATSVTIRINHRRFVYMAPTITYEALLEAARLILEVKDDAAFMVIYRDIFGAGYEELRPGQSTRVTEGMTISVAGRVK
jgi:hypothetical protein